MHCHQLFSMRSDCLLSKTHRGCYLAVFSHPGNKALIWGVAEASLVKFDNAIVDRIRSNSNLPSSSPTLSRTGTETATNGVLKTRNSADRVNIEMNVMGPFNRPSVSLPLLSSYEVFTRAASKEMHFRLLRDQTFDQDNQEDIGLPKRNSNIKVVKSAPLQPCLGFSRYAVEQVE